MNNGGEQVVINPLLAAMRREEERKRVKEAERMRRRQLRAERRNRARAGSGSNGRTSKRNSSQLPLPIPSYEELAKNLPRTNSDETLVKAKLGAPAVGRPLHLSPTTRRIESRNGENGPVAGPKRKGGSLIKSTPSLGVAAEGPKTVERRLSTGSNSSASELSEAEEEGEKKRSSTGGEQWNWLKEESGLYYLDAEALDVLQKWLQDLRLPVEEYLKLFISQGFDNLQTIALLKEDDIAQIGITKIGHRKKIMFWAQNHRPPHYEELMTIPDYDPSEDQDLQAMNNFTSWIDYNTSNSAPGPSPRLTSSNSTSPTASPSSSAPATPTSLTPTSPSSSSTTAASSTASTVNNKPKAKTKDK